MMKWSTLSFIGLALLVTLVSPVQAKSDCELLGTYWRAVAIDGNPVTVESNKREPHLVFSSEGRVSGSTGCNRLSGTFEQGADSFRFKQMITTKMAARRRCTRWKGPFSRSWELPRRCNSPGILWN